MTWEDLNELNELHRERKSVEEMLERLRASVQRTSPNLDGMPHGGQQHDIMAEYAANYDEALRRLSDIDRRLTERIDLIENELRTAPLNPRQIAVVWSRHAEGLSWGKICHELYYSKAGVFKIYKQALTIMGIRKSRHK